MLEKGLLTDKDDDWMYYYDPKLKVCDEAVIGKLLRSLEKWGLMDETVLVFCSDHGTNLGERPASKPFYRQDEPACPCHLNLYDINTKVACIFKDSDLPKGIKIPGQVRSVDIIPTILDLLEVSTDGLDMDGTSLLPDIQKGKAEIESPENGHLAFCAGPVAHPRRRRQREMFACWSVKMCK